MIKTPYMKNDQLSPLACVILAAGQGTRMLSDKPKVMHSIAGMPMVRHVINACSELWPEKIIVVVAPGMEQVCATVAPHKCAVQESPLGTGDAVRAARNDLSDFSGDIIVLFGDTPLVTSAALEKLQIKRKETGADIVVAGFVPDEPGAYGRLVLNDTGDLEAIVEAKDARPEQLKIKVCNGGIMLFSSKKLWRLIVKLNNNNAKKEFYLTDCIGLAREAGMRCVVTEASSDDVMGINNRVDLAEAERVMQQRLRREAMLGGVTLIDPDTAYLSVDTKFGKDVTIGPNVVIGSGVEIGDGVVINPFCHIEKTKIGAGAIIGPFARLRPGSVIGGEAHIGNFVEIKNSEIGKGSKVNHLSYVGDAQVGAKTNIGAGTITCNYDGFRKSKTQIGDGVFIGSNTALVAPVKVGDGAMIGAGSVITKEVPADSLGVERSHQTNLEDWAKKFRLKQKS